MPATDTTFIIGSIREQEKDLLSPDNYQRLADAENLAAAKQALTDTVYASYPDDPSLHLKAIRDMLADLVESPSFIEFISARYDGLNIASALLEKKLGLLEPSELSPLGTIPFDLLHSVIWHNLGLEALPAHWQNFITNQLNQPTSDGWQTNIIIQTGQHTIEWLKKLAKTRLMKSIASLNATRLNTDNQLRFSNTPLATITSQLESHGYHLPLEHLQSVRQLEDATAYEKFWDTELIKLINTVRYEPTGYDPILGFWYAKEIEVKSLRLLLATKDI